MVPLPSGSSNGDRRDGVVAWIDDWIAIPHSHLNSCDADGDRASQLQHPVQDFDRDINLGRPTPVLP
jgi:hypothetical protein